MIKKIISGMAARSKENAPPSLDRASMKRSNQIKKLLPLTLIILLLLPLSTAFGYTGTGWILDDINNFSDPTQKNTGFDNNLDTSAGFRYEQIYHLNGTFDITSYYYEGNFAPAYTFVTFYGEGGVLISRETLQRGTISVDFKGVKAVALHNANDANSVAFYEFDIYGTQVGGTPEPEPEPEPIDTTPTSEISNLSPISYTDRIDFSWTVPTDSDYSTTHIYQDGLLIGSSSTGQYSVLNLTPDTLYTFNFKSEDTNGNITTGLSTQMRTTSEADILAPSAPTGLTGTIASNGTTLSWNKNTETDVQGYNVYIDGVKYNATPITGTSYTVTGLESGTSYSFKITAVDTSNNESSQSASHSITPSTDALPILEMGYSLSDVAEGTANWFSSLWLIIAFAVAIPLSFYIANRIKLLFLS